MRIRTQPPLRSYSDWSAAIVALSSSRSEITPGGARQSSGSEHASCSRPLHAAPRLSAAVTAAPSASLQRPSISISRRNVWKVSPGMRAIAWAKERAFACSATASRRCCRAGASAAIAVAAVAAFATLRAARAARPAATWTRESVGTWSRRSSSRASSSVATQQNRVFARSSAIIDSWCNTNSRMDRTHCACAVPAGSPHIAAELHVTVACSRLLSCPSSSFKSKHCLMCFDACAIKCTVSYVIVFALSSGTPRRFETAADSTRSSRLSTECCTCIRR